VKIPIPALIAAIVVATSIAILISVVPTSSFAPPVVYPSTTFTVPAGGFAVYAYSATSISATSNVTADFYLAGLPGLAYVALSCQIPPSSSITVYYYDPLAGTSGPLVLKTDSSGALSYVIYGSKWTTSTCSVSDAVVPAAVYNAGNSIIVYPDFSKLSITANGTGVYVYDASGALIAACRYGKSYTATKSYSDSVANAYASFIVNGTSISAVVRPFVVAAVSPSGNARIMISAS